MTEGIVLLILIGLFIAYMRLHGKHETLLSRIHFQASQPQSDEVREVLRDLSRPL